MDFTMTQVDALWTLIQNQTKSVRQALVRHIMEEEYEMAEVERQKNCCLN